MKSRDPAFFKYIEYFKKMPQMQQYYLLVGKAEKGVNAKELSEKVNRSIQTVTNALRDLERTGLLRSEKKGRTRTYELKDPRLFQGLIQQYSVLTSPRKPGQDLVSTSIFNENLEKWLGYLAKIMRGTLYVNKVFRTHVMDIQVDYVIENNYGQSFIMLCNLGDEKNIQSALGKILLLIISKDIIPNLNILFIVGLVANNEQWGTAQDLLTRLGNASNKLDVFTHYTIQSAQPGDLAKADFAEGLSLRIAEFLPEFGNELLPGEFWGDESKRRMRALRSIQDKAKAKKGILRLQLGRPKLDSRAAKD
jgi:DNA-binding transcriptional ArsR family regulator